MQVSKVVFAAEISIIILLLFLIFNVYATWVGAVLTIIVGIVIYARIRLTMVVPLSSSPFLIQKHTTKIEFKDSMGKLVQVTKDQVIKPCKGKATEFIDRNLSGTGRVDNFKSFRYLNQEGKWKECKINSIRTEGGSFAISTLYDQTLTEDTWTRRKFEFDFIDCFLEEEESFIYRVDNPTESFDITFVFNPNRKPEQIIVYKVIGGYKKQSYIITPKSVIQPTIFEWSIRNPLLAFEYLFIWTWRKSFQ
ncbi:MAG: hypothetical protein MUP17_02835 [candidate division Zixibacteria bacterium]|nr:hypothetical protein [candidate division Zixibacteria bacterium]